MSITRSLSLIAIALTVVSLASCGKDKSSTGPDPAPIPAPSAPIAPTNLSVTPQGMDKAVLSWQDNSSDEAAFVIERAVEQDEFVPFAETPSNVATFTDQGLEPCDNYSYRVSAKKSDVQTAFTNTANRNATLHTSDIPALTSITEGANALTLNWSQTGSPAATYRIFRRLANSPFVTFSLLQEIPGNEFEYLDRSVIGGEEYLYYVIADNACGTSTASNAMAGIADCSGVSLLTPTNLTAEVFTSINTVPPFGLTKKLKISWNDPNWTESGWEIYRTSGNPAIGLFLPFTKVGEIGMNGRATASWIDGSAVLGTYYKYQVRAKSENCVSAYSNIVGMTFQ